MSLKKMTNHNVYLFIPNIIGYIRVLLALSSFAIFQKNLVIFCVFNAANQLLDAADGWAARRYNQTSNFGKILDQITDRLSTVLLYLLNSNVNSEYMIAIGLLMIADIGGHYIHATSCLIAGNKSHKKIDDGDILLKLYYENPAVMFVSIVCYETFWISAYVFKVSAEHLFIHKLSYYTLMCSIPLAMFKAYTNISQGIYGANFLVQMDTQKKK
ncbi:CDP-diacylglycerol--inositol 3-phosphatidyltransferase [Hepatocystis sp. ex Piliocolobus tephrosceles]|uniref:CDP-diacylglycerol--inositol 3-phosphatidyltransferase n=1 Tax=Piliocolobus tephrosceles TaxID=591936 RepID=A0A8C9HI64_9PRIM|nr:CDP-diacylglycerol--inositol 3-phosphatidyltransferase [Hepatocystis sp. ex Piliocolobus tephrosceles]